jgi:endonuclease III
MNAKISPVTRLKKVNIDKIYSILKAEFDKHPMPVVELINMQENDPFKVLVTTILSARTKDETTSRAARKLFSVITNMHDLDKTSISRIVELIYPVGFYKNKARYLKLLPAAVEKLFGNVIPQSVDELVKLPGVGRKTANLVVAVAFNKPAICVDVHVHRICNRLGYLKTRTPFETEMKLRKILPVKYWTTFNSYLVSFGQHLCRPVNPECNVCPISEFCNKVNVKTKFKTDKTS